VTKVRVRPDEPFEKALRRFKKKCNKEGLMQRLKEIKYYEKPSERRRRKEKVSRFSAMLARRYAD
jgi:small subunit ribosomal protein S21